VRFLWILFFLFSQQLLTAQNNAACIEKSSRNNYIAGGDTSLILYKAISQTGNTKLLLFTVRSSANINTVPTLAKVDSKGDITWSRALVAEMQDYVIWKFDALVLHDNTIFVFCISRPVITSAPTIYSMLWLDQNGTVIRQIDYRMKDIFAAELSLSGDTKLTETISGNILFMANHSLQSNNQAVVLVGNISATGFLQWTKFLKFPTGNYSTIDLMSYDNYIILQGLTQRTSWPNNTILNSTKLNLADGSIVSSISHRDYSDVGFGPGYSPVSILTEDHKIKTLVSWRIPYYYQIYFSFTQDTSFNMLQSTTFYTATRPESYLPACAALNKKGMSIIKSRGGYDPTNTSYFIADINNAVLQQKKVDNSPIFNNYTSSGNTEVAFDDKDSIYFYWSGKKDNKNIVGWIKSGIQNTGEFCGVKDSSFIQSNDYPMMKYDLKLNTLAENVFEPTSLNIILSSPLIKKELVCEKITGFCNPIKIRPVDTVCSISEAIKITVNKNPECRGKILFNFDTSFVKNWQQPDDTTLLLYFDKSWNGKIQATASFCPSIKDSLQLVVNAPLPGIYLGNDTVLCKGDTLKLFAGDGFYFYSWQNGSSNTAFYSVTKEGIYSVTVKDNCFRSYSDTIKIVLIDKKVNVGPDLTICKKEMVRLTAKGNFLSYTWTPSYNINNIHLSAVMVNPEVTTSYKITALTPEGCVTKDTILVTVKDCPLNFFVPGAFTPNKDGKNDVFKPVATAPLEQYAFSIFNRWGERIFYTNELSKGWDGKLNGIDQQTGNFAWICTYKFYDQPVVFKKGVLILIR